MRHDITFVIATRKGSKRVKNKNTRKFGNSSLLEIKLKQIRRLFKSSKILLSSDCKKSILIGKKHKTIIDIRPKKYASDNVPMKKVYSYLASKVHTKYICYLHVTSPFLKDESLLKAIKVFFNKRRKNNCTLATMTSIKEYIWYKNKAINYNPKNHPRSQVLPNFLALNFAINIVEKNYMLKEGRIVGEKLIPIVLNFPENIDIDNIWQFKLGNILINKNFF